MRRQQRGGGTTPGRKRTQQFWATLEWSANLQLDVSLRDLPRRAPCTASAEEPPARGLTRSLSRPGHFAWDTWSALPWDVQRDDGEKASAAAAPGVTASWRGHGVSLSNSMHMEDPGVTAARQKHLSRCNVPKEGRLSGDYDPCDVLKCVWDYRLRYNFFVGTLIPENNSDVQPRADWPLWHRPCRRSDGCLFDPCGNNSAPNDPNEPPMSPNELHDELERPTAGRRPLPPPLLPPLPPPPPLPQAAALLVAPVAAAVPLLPPPPPPRLLVIRRVGADAQLRDLARRLPGASRLDLLNGSSIRMSNLEGLTWMRHMLAARCYLEWGAGGTTVLAAWRALQHPRRAAGLVAEPTRAELRTLASTASVGQSLSWSPNASRSQLLDQDGAPVPPIRRIDSVESSETMINALRARSRAVRLAEARRDLTLHAVDIGRTSDWGAPSDWLSRPKSTREVHFRGYVEAVPPVGELNGEHSTRAANGTDDACPRYDTILVRTHWTRPQHTCTTGG